MNNPRIGFITSVKLGLSCMEAIYESGQKISLVITLPNDKSKKKSGRVLLDNFCNEKKIPLLKVSHINQSEVVEKVKHKLVNAYLRRQVLDFLELDLD